MNPSQNIVDTLAPFITDERKEKIESVLEQRSYGLTLLLENLFDSGNINAILRTAENFGIQELHVTQSVKVSRQNRTTKGADQWLDVIHWNDSKEAIRSLKQKGYRLIVSALSEKAVALDEVQWSAKDCIVLGREKTGCSSLMQKEADLLLQIPTVGFTQSLNVSVAAATMVSYNFWEHKKLGINRSLSEEEKLELRARFYEKSAPGRMVDNFRNHQYHTKK